MATEPPITPRLSATTEGEITSGLLVRLLEILANCLTGEVANVHFAQSAGLFAWSLDVVNDKEPVARCSTGKCTMVQND